MSDERDRLAIARGYPPEAHHVLCVDFDGTLYPWGYIDDEPEPLPGAIEAMQRLKAHGFRIVIFTSRLSPAWLASAGYDAAAMREKVERLLNRDGIPFVDITGEKIAAQAYIDDRAIRFDGDWPPIVDWLLWSSHESP